MHGLRNRFGLALALALAVSAAVAPPASAQSASFDGQCTVDGLAVASPAWRLQGGTGDYYFAQLWDDLRGGYYTFLFRCVGAVDGEVTAIEFDVSSSGEYSNNICGSGTAEDTNAVGEVTVEAPSQGHVGWTTPAIGYELRYQPEGLGVLTFTSGAEGGGGVSVILGNPGFDPDDLNYCTDSFRVRGEVEFATTMRQ